MEQFGILLNQHNIKLNRMYFHEMTRLIGVQVIYRAPKVGCHWTTYAEIDSNYQPPELQGVIYEEHPSQNTLKKIGWVSELQPNSVLIHVPYDLHDLQVGALFVLPSGIDTAKGRLFKVVTISNIMLYPASILIELVPEYIDTFDVTQEDDYRETSFNLLRGEGDDE